VKAVAQRVTFVAEHAFRGNFLGDSPPQVVGVFQLSFGDAELFADAVGLPLNAQ